nr:MAG TPA: hypothetical protein [Caudoviricetes sp.]
MRAIKRHFIMRLYSSFLLSFCSQSRPAVRQKSNYIKN